MTVDQPDKATELFQQWHTAPTPTTLSPLLTELEPSIMKALKTYGYAKDPNMRTSVQLHLANSLQRFDPQKSNIKTFVNHELKRINRLGPRHRFAIPMPEQAALDLRDVERQRTELTAATGREPTVKELADSTGLSSQKISRIQTRYATPVLTQESLAQSGQSEPGTETLDYDQLWLEAVYDGLDGVDQKIVDWTLGWHAQPTLTKTDIAAKLGLSISAISQRAQNLAVKFDEGRGHQL